MNHKISLIICLITCFLTTSCATKKESYQFHLKNKGVDEISPEQFKQCHGYGCKEIANVQLSNTDWKNINNFFTPAPHNAKNERIAIAKAIGAFENIVGEKTGTLADQYGTFRKLGKFQLDCVDESINTTIYMSLLESKDYIKFHKIEPPSARLPIIHAGRWPHQTATISEIKTSIFYAVDSWFHDNGYAAEIVTLREWKNGWKPKYVLRHGDSYNKE
ncbi:MAG: hypothetical protein KAJ86_00700 [Alphaproteobacteria bacterium]|nr:hypothetical protein [Alphaproteobacteria bacterium]